MNTTNNIVRAAKAAFSAAAAARKAASAESHAVYWAWYDALQVAEQEARSCDEWVQSYEDAGEEVPTHVIEKAKAADAELARLWAAQPVEAVEASNRAQDRLYETLEKASEAGTLLAHACAKNVDTRRQAVAAGLVAVRRYAHGSVVEPEHGHMAFF